MTYEKAQTAPRIVASRKERMFYPSIKRTKQGKSHRPSEGLTLTTVITDQKKESQHEDVPRGPLGRTVVTGLTRGADLEAQSIQDSSLIL